MAWEEAWADPPVLAAQQDWSERQRRRGRSEQDPIGRRGTAGRTTPARGTARPGPSASPPCVLCPEGARSGSQCQGNPGESPGIWRLNTLLNSPDVKEGVAKERDTQPSDGENIPLSVCGSGRSARPRLSALGEQADVWFIVQSPDLGKRRAEGAQSKQKGGTRKEQIE